MVYSWYLSVFVLICASFKQHISHLHSYFIVVHCIEVILRYRDGAGNNIEENSSIFSLIRMR